MVLMLPTTPLALFLLPVFSSKGSAIGGDKMAYCDGIDWLGMATPDVLVKNAGVRVGKETLMVSGMADDDGKAEVELWIWLAVFILLLIVVNMLLGS